MTNVSMVETYGKNLKKAAEQTRELFKKLQAQTKSVATYWKDDQFKGFEQDFNSNVLKSISESTTKMEVMADYVEKMVALSREMQALKRH